ncbi:MAG TPA: S8 family peptidase [Bryobacteraceae bacterium]|nr:S8 family peptidase [Bryobacteraceae bacterium]
MSWEPEPEDLQPESAPEQQQAQPSLRPALSRPALDRPAAPRAPEPRHAPPPPPVEPPVHHDEPDHEPPERHRFDPLLVLGLVVLLVGGGLMQLAKDVKPPAPHLRPNLDPVNGQIVVDLKDNATGDQVAELNRKFGIQLIFNSPQSLKHKLMVAFVDSSRRAEVLAGLRSDPLVEAADTNDPVGLFASPGTPGSSGSSGAVFIPNDPAYPKQWHLKMIGMEQAWTVTKGKGATVAVIDSGVGLPDKTQYRLPEDFQQTSFAKGYDFVDHDDQPEDENHHGTHVAGTIAESTDNHILGAGVAPEATIMAVRVMGADGSGDTANIVDGIHFAADNGANVINLSLGGGRYNDVFEKAITYAHDKGVFLACAAGNDGHEPVSYPAAYQGCMAVSAVGPNKELADYSNFGDQIEIAGPGGDQDKGGADAGVWQNSFIRQNGVVREGLLSLQGTSMATPHVAGVAALLVSMGKKDPDEIREILRKSATPLGPAKQFGAGLLNAEEALKMTGQKPVQKNVQWTVLAVGMLVVYLLAQRGTSLSAVISLAAGFFFPLALEKIVGFGSIWNLLGHSVIVPVIWLMSPNLAKTTVQNAAAFTFGLGLHFAVDIWTGASPFQIVPERRIVLWFIVNLIIGAYLIVSAMFQPQPAKSAVAARGA